MVMTHAPSLRQSERTSFMLKTLSPYLTRHLKRYGDYVIDLQQKPQPLEAAIALSIHIDGE
jgi:hypothetical protein